MEQFGIWTESDGGFCENGYFSHADAAQRIEELIEEARSEGETPDEAEELAEDAKADLRVVEECPDHPEQLKDSCEECGAEEEPDEDGEY